MIRTILLVALAASLVACGGRLAQKPARMVNFSGRWAIDETLSDNADSLIEQQHQKMLERMRRRRDREDMEDETQGRNGGLGRMFFDPSATLRRLSAAFMLNARHLEIKQTNASLSVSDGDLSTDYVFGQKSVVSMLSGAADREVGWKDDALIVQTRSPDGPGVVQNFQLGSNGRQLIISTRLAGADVSLAVKRVYRLAAVEKTGAD